jgi:hypothetical protein
MAYFGGLNNPGISRFGYQSNTETIVIYSTPDTLEPSPVVSNTLPIFATRDDDNNELVNYQVNRALEALKLLNIEYHQQDNSTIIQPTNESISKYNQLNGFNVFDTDNNINLLSLLSLTIKAIQELKK